MKQPRHARLILRLLLLVLALGAWSLRVCGLNWDQGYGLHPDERYITWITASLRVPDTLSDFFRPERTGLSPYMWPPDGRSPEARSRPFSYGHLPLYLLVIMAGGDGDEVRLALIGRVLSALFDIVTVFLTLALGRMLYGAFVGISAAALVTFTVLHIQLAHYATFDTALTCFALATLLFSTRFGRHGNQRDAIVASLCLGLAVGTKFSAVLLLVPLSVAYMLHWNCSERRVEWHSKRHNLLVDPAGLFILNLVIAVLVFCLTNPYSLIQVGEFIENLSDQGAMLRGNDGFPFTRQYHGTWPYIYHIEQLFRWGLGLPLGLVALGGMIYALVENRRSPLQLERWIPLAWVLVYFGFVGSLYVKFMRYMLPILPVLALFGARGVHACGQNIHEGTRRLIGPHRSRRVVSIVPIALVILPTVVYAVAFINVYRGEHPWLVLSRWIYNNIPIGTTIAYEQWDHQLPLTIDQQDGMRWSGDFRQVALDVYAPDAPSKLRAMLRKLAISDYLIIASNRLYGSTANWPERYPLMRRYYELLLGEQLGFQVVAVTSVDRHPQLGPLVLVADPFDASGLPSPLPSEREQPTWLTMDLGRADESFTVYDHPRPVLFWNVARLSPTEMESKFVDALNDRK